ncbi:anthranilate phosphoribosyltransferase [Aliidiomarina sedimenti]|uniref:Anthranilate phosphoribosyltransferase n=2 Tax=Aliidiomarina TaxID=1249554 RepID=A0A432WGV8_9GAMM|nr:MULTISPECIES: anthranilate phosphoribosyltransferase [Aliidiomarina]RUO28880.1 anthranilate phosphoribosyltransferase [Aliidiomarina sedimenti]RUO33066.1 anthranilate phosphoribosyltransferase [Aliidiomarina soli]
MQQLARVLNGEVLDQVETDTMFSYLIQGRMTDAQIAGMLLAMKIRGETPAEIAGAAQALRRAAKPFPRPDYTIADTCGTGGDGSNTINISTAAAVVAASMGVAVAKHGNRSVSSRSGSADVLEAMKIPLDGPPDEARSMLDNYNFCFLFAPHYHPGFKHAMPARQELKTRTLFNLLGPLINPAQPDVQLLGVYRPELCEPVAQTLQLLGCKRAMVVHGSGLDELALHAPTKVVEVNGADVSSYELTPADFGVSPAPVSDLKGGDANMNARLLNEVFRGEGPSAHRHAIAMNVAALLHMTGRADNFKDATEEALTHIDSGAVATHLQHMQYGVAL